MAELRIADRNGKKVVVNTRLGDTEVELEDRSAGVSGVKILQPGVLSGPHLKIQKGSFGTVATLKIEEGMWEQKRGRKVKGGERKRKIEEKREKVRKEKEEREKALGLS